jgi:hypothetical protein
MLDKWREEDYFNGKRQTKQDGGLARAPEHDVARRQPAAMNSNIEIAV